MDISQKADLDWTEYAGEGRLPNPGDKVHLWELRPSPRFFDYLPAEERQRAKGISHEETRINFATAQGGLRVIVAGYMGLSPWEIRPERQPQGKPYVPGGPEFNLSHSGGRIFAAFSASPVGLDVENGGRSVRAEDLAKRYFFAEEYERIRAAKGPGQSLFFLRHWVCKEAAVKLTGEGIYRGLPHMRVDLEFEKTAPSSAPARGEIAGRNLFLSEFSPAKSFVAALATWHCTHVNCFFRI